MTFRTQFGNQVNLHNHHHEVCDDDIKVIHEADLHEHHHNHHDVCNGVIGFDEYHPHEHIGSDIHTNHTHF
jgi:hypothetical protein